MGAFSRSALVAAALVQAGVLAAQAPATVVGRVARFAGADTVPLPGAEVVLHRVGSAAQGPIDSMRAGPDGRFRFRFQADSGVLYLLSARHHGIAYFTSPVAREPAARVDDILLIVSDTSSSAPVHLAARSLIIGAPEPSGDRPVVEVLEFANRGRQTRVGPDSVATFGVAMARGGEGFTLEDTDLSPDAVIVRNDSLLIMAPLAPGARMAIVQYRLPAGVRALELPAGLAVDTMQLLLEPGGLVPPADLPAAGEETIEGRRYLRRVGPWPADTPLVIRVSGVTFTQRTALMALVGALAVAFGAFIVRMRGRRARAGAAIPAARRPEELVEALARLDARYRGAESETPAEEWRRYETERARLKAELETLLAGTARRS